MQRDRCFTVSTSIGVSRRSAYFFASWYDVWLKMKIAGSNLTLPEAALLLKNAGATRAYAKILAHNDTSKQQVYLAGGFAAINAIPARIERHHPRGGPEIFYGHLDFHWLDAQGGTHFAPHAKLILYPQYPEVRLSGFLRGVSGAPAEVFRQGAGDLHASRVLLLGVTPSSRVLAIVCVDCPTLVSQVGALPSMDTPAAIRKLPLDTDVDSRQRLLEELARVHRLGWIPAKRLSGNEVVPCRGQNCGGYTLEAELGVSANSESEPDFMGWEVKQHAVPNFCGALGGAITLMTPEPQGGAYKTHGVLNFVRKYGYADRKGRTDRLNFGGVYRANRTHSRTRMCLEIDGYDPCDKSKFRADGQIRLRSDTGENAASWRFVDLLEHWKRKHSQAAYVPSMNRANGLTKYHYGPFVRLAVGTDFLLFLHALSCGVVYFDPGVKVEGASTSKPKVKRRSQFRIQSKDIGELYHAVSTERLA